ncbi:MAG: 16S rRNA (guanine(527)-N(7))-methyltransferase RsmG [Clostridia bacterium]|nr:16S rRNA (guanine(527)-N(7))-methyltransferase RsmG [Clostridia bacterium]
MPAEEMSYDRFECEARSIFACTSLDDSLLEDGKCGRYYQFLSRMLSVNGTMNLTAIRNMHDCIWKHLADSLTVCGKIPAGASVLDIGCGAGFPSVPLAIARPDIRVSALDSTGKKTAFVREAAEMLGLENLRTLTGRAEMLIRTQRLRGVYDVVVSRAVARADLLSELALPFLKTGGVLVMMKGPQGGEELEQAQGGIRLLGGETDALEAFVLSDGIQQEQRINIIIKKTAVTPERYPRPWAQMTKSPLH